MPDLVTHVWFAGEVLAALPPEIREKARGDLCVYASAGPDVWFPCGFYGGPDKALAPRGGYMHENETGAFLTALAARCRESMARDELFSYLSGYICHYSLDTAAHPYIVYRTGNYEQTPETLRYRGNHTRLERAIDAAVIRDKYHTTTRRYDLVRRALPLKRLPESLRDDIDEVYREVYGWEDVWAALNRAIRDHRLLYWLLRDTTGILDRVTKWTDDGKSVYETVSSRGFNVLFLLSAPGAGGNGHRLSEPPAHPVEKFRRSHAGLLRELSGADGAGPGPGRGADRPALRIHLSG